MAAKILGGLHQTFRHGGAKEKWQGRQQNYRRRKPMNSSFLASSEKTLFLLIVSMLRYNDWYFSSVSEKNGRNRGWSCHNYVFLLLLWHSISWDLLQNRIAVSYLYIWTNRQTGAGKTQHGYDTYVFLCIEFKYARFLKHHCILLKYRAIRVIDPHMKHSCSRNLPKTVPL